MSKTNRDLTIAKSAKLRASSRILKSTQNLLATIVIMTTKFQITKENKDRTAVGPNKLNQEATKGRKEYPMGE